MVLHGIFSPYGLVHLFSTLFAMLFCGTRNESVQWFIGQAFKLIARPRENKSCMIHNKCAMFEECKEKSSHEHLVPMKKLLLLKAGVPCSFFVSQEVWVMLKFCSV